MHARRGRRLDAAARLKKELRDRRDNRGRLQALEEAVRRAGAVIAAFRALLGDRSGFGGGGTVFAIAHGRGATGVGPVKGARER